MNPAGKDFGYALDRGIDHTWQVDYQGRHGWRHI